MNEKEYNKIDNLPPGGYGCLIISFLLYVVVMILVSIFARSLN